jgi:glycosyltransferase involved in cell wall biosynthesis
MRRVDFAVAYGWEGARYLDSLDSGVPVVIGRNTTILPPERQHAASTPLELLAVSRAERGKALDLLITAVLELRGPAVRLTLVGDGPELPALQELAVGSDRVRFLGALPHDRVLQEYALADVFLFPSGYDIFGLVLVEAMAAGLGVVTSIAPGALPDIALDGSNCLVVTEPSADAWASAIHRLAGEPAFREELGRAAARTVRQRWTVEHAAESMLAAFHLGLMTRHEGTGT